LDYKVCIPTAGTGSRVKELTAHLNKSLIPIANKPVIARLVEKFPADVEIVVGVGYRKDLVQDFLEISFPDRRFVFVDVDPFEGPGSGLGHTLRACSPHLQCPFVFASCDTIVAEPIPEPDVDWMGFASEGDPDVYRTLRLADDQVVEICEKGATGNVRPYIGLAGIHDFATFWERMASGDEAIGEGESFGLRALTGTGIAAHEFTWHDTGNPESLAAARAYYERDTDPNILPKVDEATWFVGGGVIKFATDEKFIANRVLRSAMLEGFSPPVVESRRNFYRYDKVEGDTLSDVVNVPLFEKFLQRCTDIWTPAELDEKGQADFQALCMDFYRRKTMDRTQQFFSRFELTDQPETINGVHVPALADVLARVDWDMLAAGTPARFHGDLHLENVLYNPTTDGFTYLDWRQDFGGHLSVGDVYYDLGKIRHGLIVSHPIIMKDGFRVDHRDGAVDFDLYRSAMLVECDEAFSAFLDAQGYLPSKVDVLTNLIFLNIAALHHYPYSHLLFSLGKKGLWDTLSAQQVT
jgi:hypothetical protein